MGDNIKRVDTLGLTWSVQARAKGTAQIRFRVNGRPVSISTGHKSPKALSPKAQAELIRDWIKKNPVKGKGGVDFREEVERFIRLQYEGKDQHTIKEALGHLERFREALGVREVQEVTKASCEACKASMQGKYKPKTWKNFLTTVRKFVRWEISEGNLSSDPLVNFKNPPRKALGRRLTTWEPERYLATLKRLKGEDREFLEIVYETGMDSADVFQLEPSHIVEARRPDKSKFWKVYKLRAKAKSNDETIDQPLSTRAAEIILPRLKSWWDLSRYSMQINFTAAFLKKVKRAQKLAGFEPMDVKSLRHTFATRHAERYLNGEGGPPMEVLRQWMGHSPSSRTLESVYVHTKSSGLYQT